MFTSPPLAAFLTVLMLSAQAQGAGGLSPYAGHEARQIKALSQQEIDDLKAGNGSGMALAAELNGYPGPRHVRDMGPRLGLTPVQQAKVDLLAKDMEAEAVRLGQRIIEAERDLNRLFATQRVDEPALADATAEIAGLRGQLRLTHLRYHLKTKALMTPDQVARYETLRGYSASAHDGAGHGHPRH